MPARRLRHRFVASQSPAFAMQARSNPRLGVDELGLRGESCLVMSPPAPSSPPCFATAPPVERQHRGGKAPITLSRPASTRAGATRASLGGEACAVTQTGG